MRILHFEKKHLSTKNYVFQRVLNTFIPVALSFWLGFSHNYWLIPFILLMIVFEYSYVEKRFIVRY